MDIIEQVKEQFEKPDFISCTVCYSCLGYKNETRVDEFEFVKYMIQTHRDNISHFRFLHGNIWGEDSDLLCTQLNY